MIEERKEILRRLAEEWKKGYSKAFLKQKLKEVL